MKILVIKDVWGDEHYYKMDNMFNIDIMKHTNGSDYIVKITFFVKDFLNIELQITENEYSYVYRQIMDMKK